MAAIHAKQQREQRLASLNLRYPLWLFDIDDPRWPRRLDSLLPNSYPARLTGWTVSTSEYQMHLHRPQDLSHNTSETRSSKPKSHAQHTALAQDVLQALHYDDRFDLSSLQAIVSHNGSETTIPLSEWTFDQDSPGYANPSTLLCIERIHDGVHIWNPSINLSQLSDYTSLPTYYGVATLLTSDSDLLSASGMPSTDDGAGIQRAEFERLDAGGDVVEVLRGVVYPGRSRGGPEEGLGQHGIKLNLSERAASNRRLVAGTALEGKGWEEVTEYVRWERGRALF
ncbi:unnamed protein product [Zymoseptoria tritici ST99CH_1A5]|uniref:Uncharacterized protein n=2 Tax=Zymoseptoria tritici TaxID=1047171 RepID=A0A2H1G4X8_ZYMTR|nr:unnamed protein product [Zymoseptoria tritici ST99CH_1E4]SMY22485.1 unnamed protein product [Zymoseptoria tritici ST99CH_1A5]